jgi:hypothetical protein
VHPIVSWPFVHWKRPRCGAFAAGCATAHCGSRMPSSMAVSTGCYCRRCVGLRHGEPSSAGTICPRKADPFIERVLAQIGSGCESLSAALSAEELMGLDMIDAAILIPGARLADIRRASRLLEEDRSLRRANDAVVEFMLAHSIAKACWGTESLVRRSGALGTRKDGPGDLGPAGASARLGLERDQGIYWERGHGAPSGSGARHALRRL